MKLINQLCHCLFLALGLMVTGCAYIPEQVNLEYHPQIQKPPVCLNQSVDVCVYTIDNRRCKEVGCKKGDGNIELGSLTLKNDIASLVNTAVVEELKKCRFNIAETGVNVEIEINRFHCDFKQSALSWNCFSEIMLNVNVIKLDGTIVYSKTIIGAAENIHVWFSTGENAKIALESALSDAICKLINDRFFLQALQKT